MPLSTYLCFQLDVRKHYKKKTDDMRLSHTNATSDNKYGSFISVSFHSKVWQDYWAWLYTCSIKDIPDAFRPLL